ncbi:MAG: phosphoenolpyruvate carboxylase [Armatimonadetes bacterium]|nr:phosphoenolpyruvate carboxylase [Armatimonadota bacterium]
MDIASIIHYLGNLLGQVISEQESPQLFETEERIRAYAKARRGGDMAAAAELAHEAARLSSDTARAVATAFTIYFDLVNLAEETHRVHMLRERERTNDPLPIDESIGEVIMQLKNRGLSSDQVNSLLRTLHIELVLTAHPTEAKRRTILSGLKRISDIVRIFYETEPLPRERLEYEDALLVEITGLWLTSRVRTDSPAVTDEVRTGLYFVDEVFWDAIPRIYKDLDAALAKHYSGVSTPPKWLTIASWIGGDRDGNPNVTTVVTAETLRLHRGLAVERHCRSFHDLARRLSLNDQRIPAPPELLSLLNSRRPLPAHVEYLEKRYANESYRLISALLASDLEAASQEDMTSRLMDDAPHKARLNVSDLKVPMDLIATALPSRLTHSKLQTVRRQLDIFGLYVARLDLREDSSRLLAAVSEILRALNLDTHFEQKDDSARRAVLLKLLEEYPEGPQSLAKNPGVTADTAETWSLFRLIARTQKVYDRELLGPFIISMARGIADVLAVLLLARWAGCANGLCIVPLFETMADLEAAPNMLAELFQLEAYHAHLKTCDNEQTVMIGYSDSNKDGGFLAANWALYQSQERIAAVCRNHCIRLTLFHGRGGTVARGGGPANRAIMAQPPGTLNGRFRLTEQGETIASRYSNPDLAHRHLEQIASAVILASAADESPDSSSSPQATPAEWRQAMSTASAAARAAYRALVYETPGFPEYWRAATPIEEISRIRIGSRPSSRGGADLQITKIRAIPWVFSWMQSRFNLPSWFGLGTGLAQEEVSRLREMYAGWPFFSALLDNAEMALLKADMGIAALYSDLVPDRGLARSLFSRISAEYETTRQAILTITSHAELMDADPVIQRSVQLRNPYVDPLNYLQIEMLRRLRALPDPNCTEASALHEVIDITISGIASGLRNTG